MSGSTGPITSISSTTGRFVRSLACRAPPVAQTAMGARASNTAANVRRITIECTAGGSGVERSPSHLRLCMIIHQIVCSVSMYRVGIVGASGYAGAELLRLCFEHPELEASWAMGETQAGTQVADLYPSLAAAFPGLRFEAFNADLADGLDLVFMALPHGMSQQMAPDLRRRADKII